ncbi:MAG: hypothetical protein JW986_02630 [Methanotrichaceae archaeon]|nr:hypothetical protein [Methanotrichaceae archaeon]
MAMEACSRLRALLQRADVCGRRPAAVRQRFAHQLCVGPALPSGETVGLAIFFIKDMMPGFLCLGGPHLEARDTKAGASKGLAVEAVLDLVEYPLLGDVC